MGPTFAKGYGAADLTRRDVLRGGRDLATLLSLSTLAGVESPLVVPAEAAQDVRRHPWPRALPAASASR